MLTYRLFKIKRKLLSERSRKCLPEADLQSIQNPEHALVRYKQGRLARRWLTSCLRPRACCCQLQEKKASQMLTYSLITKKSMLSSETSEDACQILTYILMRTLHQLQPSKASHMLTYCLLKFRACSCQLQAGKASQMLTHSLFKIQSMFLSVTSRESKPDADSQPVQTQHMLLLATSRKALWDAGLHSVQNPEHALVSNKQGRPARCWLTNCSKPRACSCQQQGDTECRYTLLKMRILAFLHTNPTIHLI